MRVEYKRVDWPFVSPFRISYQTLTHSETVVLKLIDGDVAGCAEAQGVSYHGESADSIVDQLTQVEGRLAAGISRQELPALLPAGGARNAVDCALWDLDAKRAGRRAWELAGIRSVRPLITDITLVLDTPDSMRRAAIAVPQYEALKLKLGGSGDLERVAAVRAVRPDAKIIVDANQSWTEQQLREFSPALAELGVLLIEQPLPAGDDEALLNFNGVVPLCADESCQTAASLPSLRGKYQYINIKLDKTGGLSEALALAEAAASSGFKLMVGCMGGSSLAMAPAFIVGQRCDFVDLDGPLLSAADVAHPLRYQGSVMYPPSPALWG